MKDRFLRGKGWANGWVSVGVFGVWGGGVGFCTGLNWVGFEDRGW